MPHPVSAVIITFNEASIIESCINALKWCDEIIVVDSGSTDNTVELCKQAGCKVIHQPFLGFGAQKRFAVEQASNHWVLNIDADEICTPELQKEIQSLLQTQPSADAYEIPRQLFFLGKAFRFGRESKQYQTRLFDKTKANFNTAEVHEKVEAKSKEKLKNILLHYSYQNLSHYFDKFNTYTTKGAQVLKEKGKKRPPLLIIAFYPWYFFKFYILERNFMNGFAGFVWSVLSSHYVFVKYTKRYEMNG